MLEQIADQILKHPKVILLDDYELVLQKTEVETSHQKKDETTTKTLRSEVWFSLRVIAQNKPAAITGTDLNEIPNLVERVYQLAKISTIDPWFRFPILRKSIPRCEAPILSDGTKAPFSGHGEHGFSLENKGWSQEHYLRRKNEKKEFFFENKYWESKLKLSRSIDDVPISFWQHSFAPQLNTSHIEITFDRLEQKTNWIASIDYKSELKGQVAFSSQAFARILESVAPWFLASQKRFSKTPIPDAIPNAIFSEALTIYDEGGDSSRGQFFPWDAEGTLTAKTKIIEKGVLLSFLYDTYHATKENRLSSGNFLRYPFQSKPQIQPNFLYVAPGSTSQIQELLKDGYWIDNVFNLSFSKGLTQIEGIAFPVTDKRWQNCAVLFSIKLNVMELLHRVNAVGKDLEFHGRYGAPSIFIEKLPIS